MSCQQAKNTIRHPFSAVGALALAVAATFAAAPVPAHDGAVGHGAHQGGATVEGGQDEAKRIRVKLVDLPLVDVEGRSVDFKSDAIGDRIVAVNFIYTSCTTVCPVVSAIFGAVQDQLGDGLGRGVRLVSLSIDPVTDVPPRLKSYAQKFNAGPGWIFLTGERANMDRVLAGLGAYAPDFEQHPQVVLVGDADRDLWYRFYGFPSPEHIVGELQRLIAARAAHTSLDSEEPR